MINTSPPDPSVHASTSDVNPNTNAAATGPPTDGVPHGDTRANLETAPVGNYGMTTLPNEEGNVLDPQAGAGTAGETGTEPKGLVERAKDAVGGLGASDPTGYVTAGLAAVGLGGGAAAVAEEGHKEPAVAEEEHKEPSVAEEEHKEPAVAEEEHKEPAVATPEGNKVSSSLCFRGTTLIRLITVRGTRHPRRLPAPHPNYDLVPPLARRAGHVPGQRHRRRQRHLRGRRDAQELPRRGARRTTGGPTPHRTDDVFPTSSSGGTCHVSRYSHRGRGCGDERELPRYRVGGASKRAN